MGPARFCHVVASLPPHAMSGFSEVSGHVAAQCRLAAASCAGWVWRGVATLPPVAASLPPHALD
eukprot:6045103-Pyramimonas_sp.AAC.1